MKRMLIQHVIVLGMIFSAITSFPAFSGDNDLRPLPPDHACPDELFEAGRCTRYVDLDWLEQDRNSRLAIQPLQNDAGEVPADTVKVYARLRYWHDFRYSLPWFRIHVEFERPQGFQTYFATHIGNVHWLDWEHDLMVPTEDGIIRIIPSKTRLVQAPDVPLVPGVTNRISLEVYLEGVWHKIREKLIHISPDDKVFAVKIHYLHYGQFWDFRDGAAVGQPFIGFEKYFDRSQVAHCTSPTDCTTRSDCDVEETNFPPDMAGEQQCKHDIQCPGICEDKTRCYRYGSGWHCYVPRVCLPGSCYHNWSVDEYISPRVVPVSDDPGYAYENCRVLFTVDSNPEDGYNPHETIHVIDLADADTFQYLMDQYIEISSPEDVRHAFNCGGDRLRKYAVKLAERNGAMQSGDGMLHAFFTRSLTLDNANCQMDHPFDENCSSENVKGITSHSEMLGAAYFFVALEPGCYFNETTGHGSSRSPYALVAAHEIGNVGYLTDTCNKHGKDSPKWGNLMCPPEKLQNPEVDDPYFRQNYHMFSTSGGMNQCQSWLEGLGDFNLIDLNAR